MAGGPMNAGAIYGVADVLTTSMYAVTDPATSAATATSIVDVYGGTVVTLTGAGNTQTLATPSSTSAGKIFTVVNNDTSTNNLSVVANSVTFTITPGKALSFVWDGTAWGPTDIGITAIPVTVAQGGTGRATGTSAYALVATGTTATGAQQSLAVGATTEVLVGGGASALPVWTTATGTGAPVRATSPILVTPALGTPASGDLQNCSLAVAPAIGGTTANTIRSLLDEDAEIVTADATLTANQCSGGLISNYNQSLDCTVTVPTAFAGGNFIVALSTAVAKYYNLDPTGSEIFVWDGVAQGAGKYIGIANATVGAALQFIAVQTGDSAWTWHVYTVAGGWAVEG